MIAYTLTWLPKAYERCCYEQRTTGARFSWLFLLVPDINEPAEEFAATPNLHKLVCQRIGLKIFLT